MTLLGSSRETREYIMRAGIIFVTLRGRGPWSLSSSSSVGSACIIEESFLPGMTGIIAVLGRNSRIRIDHKLSEEFPAVQDDQNNSLPYRSLRLSKNSSLCHPYPLGLER